MCRIFGTPFLFTFFYIVIKKMNKNLEKQIFLLTFASHLKTRAFSSAGLEHLPYKQRVGGSNPSTPTGVFPVISSEVAGFFCLYTSCFKCNLGSFDKHRGLLITASLEGFTLVFALFKHSFFGKH